MGPRYIRIRCIIKKVAFVDVRIQFHVYRFIAVYMPHAGYLVSEFRACLDSLRQVVHDAQRIGSKYVAGGDFHTEIGRGFRSVELLELVEELQLKDGKPNPKPTIVDTPGKWKTLSYKEMKQEARALGQFLRQRCGIQKGEKI